MTLAGESSGLHYQAQALLSTFAELSPQYGWWGGRGAR